MPAGFLFDLEIISIHKGWKRGPERGQLLTGEGQRLNGFGFPFFKQDLSFRAEYLRYAPVIKSLTI